MDLPSDVEQKLRAILANFDDKIADAQEMLTIRRNSQKSTDSGWVEGAAMRYSAWEQAKGTILRTFPELRSAGQGSNSTTASS